MKTAEEWAIEAANNCDEFERDGLFFDGESEISVLQVSHEAVKWTVERMARAIQTDALKSAAQTLKRCNCPWEEARICQFGRHNWCSPEQYWEILALIPEAK